MKKIIFAALLVAMLSISSLAKAETYTFESFNLYHDIICKVYNQDRELIFYNYKNGESVSGSHMILTDSKGGNTYGWALDPMNSVGFHYGKGLSYSASNTSARDFLGDDTYNVLTGMINVLYPVLNENIGYNYALQAAIFEFMFDGHDFDRFGGNIEINGARTHVNVGIEPEHTKIITETMKEAYKRAVNGDYKRVIDDFFILTSNDGKSAMLAFSEYAAPTPIPGVAILLGSGLGGLITLRRKFNR